MAAQPKETKSDSTNSMVTIFDVAREAGVHASTVSRALDPEQRDRVKEPTRVRILEVVDRLGYRPDLVARGLRRGRTGTIGVIAADLGSTYVTPIIHGLSAAVEVDGMLPMIAESNDEPDRLKLVIDHMLSRRVDAIVVAAARRGDEAVLERASQTVPVVLAARPLEGTDLPQVIHDEVGGARQVAEHLEGLGHREAIQLLGPDDVANFSRRRLGFSTYWAEAGLDELEPLPEVHRPSISEGRRLMVELLGREGLPTAVFAANDFIAIGALSAMHEEEIEVPGQVSLVGYNDLPTSEHLTPALTTVRTETFEIGFRAGGMVRDLLDGLSVADITLDPTLVVRASTGPAPSR